MKQIIFTTIFFIFSISLWTQNKWKSVSVGDDHTLAIAENGTLWVWGDWNIFGQLGLGDMSFEEMNEMNEISEQLDKEGEKKVGKKKLKRYYKLKEQYRTGNKKIQEPFQLGSETDWAQVYAGNSCSFAIKTDGSLWAWGDNSYGQLGNGTYYSFNRPLCVSNDKWANIALGARHTLGLKADSTLWAWGNNSYGQLGDGTSSSSNIPIQISTDKWKSIVANSWYSAAISASGHLLVWGSIHRQQPVYASSFEKFIAINLLYSSLLSSTAQDTLSIISHKNDWFQVSAGSYHLLAIDSDGRLWGMGDNDVWQLSDNIDRKGCNKLQLIDDSRRWVDVGSNIFNSYAIDSDHNMWGCGKSLELYQPQNKTYSTPKLIQIKPGSKWLKVFHQFGLDTDNNYFYMKNFCTEVEKYPNTTK